VTPLDSFDQQTGPVAYLRVTLPDGLEPLQLSYFSRCDGVGPALAAQAARGGLRRIIWL
jgi:hypothetical protein